MSKNIYEGHLCDQMSSHSHYSKKFIRKFSNELFEVIRQGLLEDGHVRLHQFGSFKLKWTNQRNGINPQTGKPLIIPAHPRVIFTASKNLKEKLLTGINQTDDNIPKSPLPTDKKKAIQHETVKHNKISLPNIDNPPYLNNLATKNYHINTLNRYPYILGVLSAITIILLGSIFYPEHNNNHNTLSLNEISTSEMKNTTDQETQLTFNNNETKHNITVSHVTTSETPTHQNYSPSAGNDINSPSENTKIAYFTATKHQLIEGNSLWRLAKKNYINPFYWPHIYQANRYTILNPDKLQIGSVIDLPALYGHPDNLTITDKHNIAEGYFLAYQYYKKTNKPHPYYALLGAVKYDPEIIEKHIYEISDEDWKNLQLASN